jgi:hypothetical protein
MKKKSGMLILILALLGCVLIGFSIYFLYQGSFIAGENNEEAAKELEGVTKKVESLSQELRLMTKGNGEEKNNLIGAFSKSASNNIPIIEITSVDLGEDVGVEGNDKKINRLTYSHEIRFFILNIGKSALKEVIFSIKDIYNEPKWRKRNKKARVEYDCFGQVINSAEFGSYNNIEANTLNLKSKKIIYSSNLPSSFGEAEYFFDVILEWEKGSYQMKVAIVETNGKLNFKYEFYDANGVLIDLKNLKNLISK